MQFRRLLIPVVVTAVACVSSPSHAMDSMESQVFGLINGERSSPLVEHSGLLAVARAHSQQMAISGGLNHDDADARITNAPPDPPEADGAPDNGFATAAWCENVTYSNGFPASDVAHRLYDQWRTSAPHQACMTNAGKNVAAVGIYYDGSTWWATFIAEVDSTPPGGAPAPGRAAAAPQSVQPAATAQPALAVPASAGEPTTPGRVEPVPESSVTTSNATAPQAAQTSEASANGGTIWGSSVRQFAADVAPVHAALVTKRGRLPGTETGQVAALVGLGLIVCRRSAKRSRMLRPPEGGSRVAPVYEAPHAVRELVSA
jgi:uncharacterized protein YkwD